MTLKLSGIIDHAYLRNNVTKLPAETKTFSHYFSDHDSITCVCSLEL